MGERGLRVKLFSALLGSIMAAITYSALIYGGRLAYDFMIREKDAGGFFVLLGANMIASVIKLNICIADKKIDNQEVYINEKWGLIFSFPIMGASYLLITFVKRCVKYWIDD